MATRDLAVDGTGLASNPSVKPTTQAHTIVTLPEPSVTFELNEIKRKLERKEMDLKRKDKEIAGYQKEMLKLSKDIKIAEAEMKSLTERNYLKLKV